LLLLLLLLWPMLTPLPLLVAVVVGVVFGVGVVVTNIVAIVIVTMVAMAILIVAMPAIPCHSGANMMVSTSAPDRRDLPRWRLRISVIFPEVDNGGSRRPHLVRNADGSATMPRGLARRNYGEPRRSYFIKAQL
jgi:hypothetical protein